MKGHKYLLLHFLFLVIGCNTIPKDSQKTSNQVKNNQHLAKIEIEYVHMYITTFVAISCKKFDETFLKNAEKETLTELKKAELFEKFVNNTISKQQLEKYIDVRGKAKLHYNNGVIKELCFGLHTIEVDGIKYAISEEFREYLLKLTETKI